MQSSHTRSETKQAHYLYPLRKMLLKQNFK